MKFSKDLRDLNEEEFREVYGYLEKETNNFKSISPELILENNKYILIFRLCTGLPQKEFSKKIGRGSDTCRHTEAGRRTILQKRIAERYSKPIEKLLKNYKITFEKTFETWKQYMFARDQTLQEPKTKFGSITKISDENLKKLYEITKERTKNFTEFNYNLLLEIPQTLLVFRSIFKEDHRTFARKLGLCPKGYRSYEAARVRVKPRTAKRVTKRLPDMFDNESIRNIKFDKILENKRILSNFFGHRNHAAAMRQGLNILAKLPQTEFENEVASLLKSHSIPFDQSSVVCGLKRDYNVDFIIPNSKDPKIIIEVFMNTMGGKSRNTISKIRSIDHRFHSIKMNSPKIKTMIIMKLTGKPILLDDTKRKYDLEILDTDKMIINQEIKDLPIFLKERLLEL
jgi:hypothetical protein